MHASTRTALLITPLLVPLAISGCGETKAPNTLATKSSNFVHTHRAVRVQGQELTKDQAKFGTSPAFVDTLI